MSVFKDQLTTILISKEAALQTSTSPLIQATTMLNNVEQGVLNLGKRVLDEFDDPTFQSSLLASSDFDDTTKQLIFDLRVDIEIKPAKEILNNPKYAIFFPSVM